MGSVYGTGVYGEGPYSKDFSPPAPVFVADRPAAPHYASHILGVGPWAAGLKWRAAPNYGLTATRVYPSLPLLAVPCLSRASFTLRRTKPSEATVETDMARGQALVIEEMVTDLWWRRNDPCNPDGLAENIGRFNATAVDASMDSGRLRMSATFVDYRGMLDDRLVLDPMSADANVTPVADVLANLIPPNSGIDVSVLATADLGKVLDPIEFAIGSSVPSSIAALQVGSPPFDWAVEMGSGTEGRPTLQVWPGRRGTDKGVVLVDDGAGFTPMASWRRRTNRDDYANVVLFTGQTGSQLSVPGPADPDFDFDLPTGQRDATENDHDLITAELIQRAANKARERLSQRTTAWDITLKPGWWQGRDHVDLGDTVRVVIRLGEDLINEAALVEEINVEIDADGTETVRLSLGWGRPARNPQSSQSTTSIIVRQIKRLGRAVGG